MNPKLAEALKEAGEQVYLVHYQTEDGKDSVEVTASSTQDARQTFTNCMDQEYLASTSGREADKIPTPNEFEILSVEEA